MYMDRSYYVFQVSGENQNINVIKHVTHDSNISKVAKPIQLNLTGSGIVSMIQAIIISLATLRYLNHRSRV